MNFRKLLVASGLVIVVGVCTGCPDKSYQAPLPDYSNMTDGGSEEVVDEPVEKLP